MQLNQLKINQNTVKVAYPRFSSFLLDLKYLPREELAKIREESLVTNFNRVTRQREDTVDTDKFMDKYIQKAVTGWSGLTVEIVSKLVPIETAGVNMSDTVPYDHESAMWLVKNSSEFDSFISDTMNQVDIFSSIKKEETLKK